MEEQKNAMKQELYMYICVYVFFFQPYVRIQLNVYITRISSASVVCYLFRIVLDQVPQFALFRLYLI